MSFDDLGLSPEVLKAISDAGYTQPTPIQEQAVPYVLMGRDVLGCAQTGTGKTASFTLPMIDILASGRARARMPRSLIIEPTRELAAQVSENFEKYGKYSKLSMALLIGGEAFTDQEKRLDRGVDVLIATPGRLLDLYERGKILLADVKILVIDEADRMLDMGFMPDVERIVGLLPKIRQTLFFSATMPPEIRRLADAFLMNQKEVTVSPPASAAETVTQRLVRTSGLPKVKRAKLRELLASQDIKSGLIFCNRKRDVGILYRSLERHGFSAAELHGDMAQPLRMSTLKRFKDGEVQLLVCSDVAARGLDIPAVSHVINFDVPVNADDYIHRIGRTGRAGRSGLAFTLSSPADSKLLAAVTKMLGGKIEETQIGNGPAPEEEAEEVLVSEAKVAEKRSSSRRSRGGKRSKAPVEKEASLEGSSDASTQSTAAQSTATQSTGKEAPATEAPTKETPAEKGRGGSPFGDHTPAFLLRPVKIVAANA